jgi:hypothetical protein
MMIFLDRMITTLENLPNEILMDVLSNMKWFEMIESFWSLNQRFNSLICLKISMNKNQIHITKRSVSFNRCHSIILSRICNLSSFFACVQSININGTDSNCCDVISQWIFHNNILRFINLKRLTLTECCLTEILIYNLSLLIQNQLDELILKFDKDIFKVFSYNTICQRNRKQGK